MSTEIDCTEWADAPFCGGPSDQGLAPCPVEDMSARGYCPDEIEGHLEELCSVGVNPPDYECDELATEQVVPEPVETLPETGPASVFVVLPLALAAIVTGVRMVK